MERMKTYVSLDKQSYNKKPARAEILESSTELYPDGKKWK